MFLTSFDRPFPLMGREVVLGCQVSSGEEAMLDIKGYKLVTTVSTSPRNAGNLHRKLPI